MTITKIAIIPPKVAPKMAAVLSLFDDVSVPSCGTVSFVGVSGVGAGVSANVIGAAGSVLGGSV